MPFDDLIIEFDEINDTSITEKAALPMVTPTIAPAPVGIDYRKEVELAKEADKLFDFSNTNLSPVQQLYVIGYAVRGTKMGACKLTNVPLSVVNKWMENDEFFNAMQNAVDIVRDVLEEELLARAMSGSDRLLIEALKATNPDKYNKKQSDVTITGTMIHSWADLAKQAYTPSQNKMIRVIESSEKETDV